MDKAANDKCIDAATQQHASRLEPQEEVVVRILTDNTTSSNE
jgi:hypothetical protein